MTVFKRVHHWFEKKYTTPYYSYSITICRDCGMSESFFNHTGIECRKPEVTHG